MVQGEGVWWHRALDGNFHFHDGCDDFDFASAGPELLHFRNAQLEDVLRHPKDCWQKALERKTTLPLDVVRHFDNHGNLSEIVSTEEPVSSDPDVSFDSSFTVPILSPPQTSTPVQGQNTVSLEPLQLSEGHVVMPEEEECAKEKENVQPETTEGHLDMAIVEEVSETQDSALRSSVCKAISRMLGVTTELQEFDCIRSLCKGKGNKAVPVMLERHKAFAARFRKQISTHKCGLKRRLAVLSHLSSEYSQCAKDLQHCLKLMVSLH